MSDIIEEFLAEFLAQDTKEDGFATLVDSEGHPYVANLNPKEKERYSETKKPLSQVKKEKKETEGKKTEEKKKSEAEKKGGAEVIELHPEKENEKKLNFADKVKKIVSQEFRYAPGISAMGEFDAKYLEKQLNKLDPHEEGAEEALEEVDKAVKSGDMRQVIAVQNAISHYAHDKEGYKRSLKATRNSYKRTVKLYDDLIEKLKKVEAPREELKTKAKEFWNKHGLDIQDVDKALNNLEKRDGLGRFSKQLKLSDKYYEVLGQIEASKNQLEIVLKRTEKFNPAKDPLYDLKLRKDYVTKAKSAAKDYFNQHNIAMDSADFAEIQALLNELDNGNNGLDLFVNNVNEEKVQNLKKTVGLAQDNALTSYFEDIEIY